MLGLVESLFALAKLRHAVEELETGSLHGGSKSPRADTEADSGHVHAERHGSGLEDATEDATVAYHEELEVELAEEDDPEPEVGEGAEEDVELTISWLLVLVSARVVSDVAWGAFELDWHLVEDTAVEHVEHVHHDEDLEHEGLVEETVGGVLFIANLSSELGGVQVVLDLEHSWTGVEQEEHDENLIEGLGEDGSHHGLGDDVLASVDALFADLSWVGVLSSKSNGSKDVHDQVDPEELHDTEGRVTKDERGGEDENDAGNVDGHLELDELAHVILDVTTITDGGDHSLEVIVHKDNIRVILGSRAAILAHSEANASLAESAGIAESLTSDTDGRSRLSESTDEHTLKNRGCSVDKADVLLDSLESLFALMGLELVGFTTVGVTIISDIILKLHEGFKLLVKIIRGNDHSFVVFFLAIEEVELECSGHDGCLVITGNESNISLAFG